MDDRTNRHKRSPNELVRQYRDIGIPAVAAAARYQSRDGTRNGPRRQERSQQETHAQQDPAAGNENDGHDKASAKPRRRSVAGA